MSFKKSTIRSVWSLRKILKDMNSWLGSPYEILVEFLARISLQIFDKVHDSRLSFCKTIKKRFLVIKSGKYFRVESPKRNLLQWPTIPGQEVDKYEDRISLKSIIIKPRNTFKGFFEGKLKKSSLYRGYSKNLQSMRDPHIGVVYREPSKHTLETKFTLKVLEYNL